MDGALSSLSDTSSGPVLASPLIPFPVHTDLGLHEAGGLGACWGPFYWVNRGKEVPLVKASAEFGGHTLGPPEGGCLWAQWWALISGLLAGCAVAEGGFTHVLATPWM